jgi:maltose O-acetyltransferase
MSNPHGAAWGGADTRKRGARGVVSLLVLWAANLLSMVTPHARLFRLRRAAFVAAGAQIHPEAKITGTVRIHQQNVVIGDSWIGPGTQLMPSSEAPVVIGDRVAVAPEVMFNCHSHDMGGHHQRAARGFSSPIRVGDGTWIGARATFLCGSAVGSGCVVAAGSVVKDVFGDDVMLAGVPARVVRELDGSG